MEKESPFSEDEFNKVLDQEFSIFKDGEKYDFVTDMKDAFKNSLRKPTSIKIFETIPEHVFWDIKKPLIGEQNKIHNPYNPFRKYPYESFFDMRDNDEYMQRRTHKDNIRDNISYFRRY